MARGVRAIVVVLGCAAMLAVDVAIAAGLFGGPRLDPQPAPRQPARCVQLAPQLPLSMAAAVRSNEHGSVWLVAIDMPEKGVGVWAVDDLAHPTMIWSVNSVAVETSTYTRAAEVLAWGRSHLPKGWMDDSGQWQTTDLYGNPDNPAWRSVTVGIDAETHGVSEAYQCVRTARHPRP